MSGPSSLMNAERARRLMREAGVDAIVATGAENVAYTSGFHSSTCWVTPQTVVLSVVTADAGTPTLILPQFEIDAWVDGEMRDSEVVVYGPAPRTLGRTLATERLDADDRVIAARAFAREDPDLNPWSALRRVAAQLGLAGGSRIAVERRRLSTSDRQRLEEALGGAELVEGTDLLDGIRMVKTAEEIARLRRATELACRAIDATAELVRPGTTERELFHAYNAYVSAHGGVPTFGTISAGSRTGRPHAVSGDYRLQAGDLVKYDVGCTVDCYHADVGRTRVVGEPSAEATAIHAALSAATAAGVDCLRPGVTPSHVHRTTMDVARDRGMNGYERHHVGHGIGIEVYDPPLLSPRNGGGAEPLVEEGMVFSVEAPYYVLGEHGFIVEDAVVVTADGTELLSDLSRELVVP